MWIEWPFAFYIIIQGNTMLFYEDCYVPMHCFPTYFMHTYNLCCICIEILQIISLWTMMHLRIIEIPFFLRIAVVEVNCNQIADEISNQKTVFLTGGGELFITFCNFRVNCWVEVFFFTLACKRFFIEVAFFIFIKIM